MTGLMDIAKKAGVSVATVSLALRGRGGVARETVERVKAVAEDLKYRPNPLLSSLASKRFRTVQAVSGTPVAVFHFPRTANEKKPPIYEQELLAFAHSLGYFPAIYRISHDTRPAKIFRELYHRMAQGVVILGPLREDFLTDFDWNQFSVVHCGRYFGPQPFHVVRPNIFQAVKLVFQELKRAGYERIGCAIGRHPEQMEDDDARFGAALAMESTLLRPENRTPVYDGRFDDSDALVAWVRRHRPDAVIGFNAAAYWILKDAGFGIPEELGFASMHATATPRSSPDVFVTGAIQNQNEIARQSVMLLDQLIRNRERGLPESPLDVLVRSTWLPGKTIQQQRSGSDNAAAAGGRAVKRKTHPPSGPRPRPRASSAALP